MPTQADDSLSSTAYAQILDLISEGPIFGPANSETPARSVYFNGTVVQNSDGSNNFNVKQVDLRTGTLTQDPISGFDSTANEVGVGVELKASAPWTHTVTNLALSALRVTLSVSALSKTNSNTGDVTGYQVAYQIQLSKDGGQYTTVVDTSFNGKASSVYQRSHRIELSGAASQYTVKVIRITGDTSDVYTQDTTNVVSYTELIDAKLRYPMSALCGVQLDASEFSSVPTRSYDMKGLLIKYPSNYNPTTRAYAGTWDGSFTTGWTDNPAWVFYDLVLNSRYGLGKWVDASMIDRYALYQIAQYCDVLVSDGAGGTEPRFSCNCYIASREDAYKVLQDIASVFRGMAYWSAGSVTATSDMPLDTAYVYTAANVIGGQFKYVGSSLKTRYTCAVVTWNDPENGYQQAVEYVEDADGVARYGINKAQLTAFACTSRAQAQRVGQWTLLTSRYETNTVTFSVGLDGTLAQPGQIIAVADPSRAGKRTGGRIKSASLTTQVTLDKALDGTVAGDTLTVILPSGKAESKTVSAVSGAVITVSQGFSVVPAAGSVWMLESSTLKSQLFRVASVAEKDGITFEITATQHEPGKYAAIDNGAAIDFRPVTGNTLTVQAPPTGVTVSQYVVTDQGISKTNMSLSWAAAAHAVSYTAQWRKDNGDWVTAGTTGGLSLDVSNIYSGNYTARVRATNGLDISSPYAYSSLTGLAGKTGAPPVVASLAASTDKIFSVNVSWTFPAGAGDTAYTEVYYSHTPDFASATQQGRYSYPTTSANLLGLAAGYDLYFWVRLVDTTGNVGAFYPATTAAGVHGQSSADANVILTYLAGQITQTQLGQDVLSPIQAIPSLQSTVAALQGTVTATSASVTDETTARIAADASLSSRVSKVEAAYFVAPVAGDPGTYAGAVTAWAGVYSEGTARAEADLALATKTDTVAAQITTTSSNMTAAINTETQARVDADAATASQITTLQASVASNTAAIQTEQTARSDGDSANAQAITTLTATVNNNSAAIQTNANAYADINGRVAASYTIKTQITSNGRTYIAGIGVGVDNTSGTVESQVLVSASRFAVLDPNGSAVSSPFVIQGGQVFMSSAFIADASITNAKIGGVIQSNAIGANGSPLWILDKNGGISFNGANGGSGHLDINSSTMSVYDGAGTLRVRVGIW
jgi:predicted phage tail protein